ncbi:MAG: hypothetical protein FJX83_05910 [Bacteroidetes bacterium]|nr:hypothetical protein [Bacteroidota bacterium]
MENSKKDWFDSVEDQFDGSNETNGSRVQSSQSIQDPEFERELEYRKKIQTAWNQSAKYETILNYVKTIHMSQKTSNNRRRLFSYAAAACIVALLSIPGYQYFVKQQGKDIQIEEAEIKSNVTFFDSMFKQVAPINGQLIGDESIIFVWESTIEVKTNIIISNASTGVIVFTRPVNSADKQFRLNQYLGRGKYKWKLEGFKGEMLFVLK